MASSLRQTLHCQSHVRFLPPFFYGWLRIVRFQRPLVGFFLSGTHDNEKENAKRVFCSGSVTLSEGYACPWPGNHLSWLQRHVRWRSNVYSCTTPRVRKGWTRWTQQATISFVKRRVLRGAFRLVSLSVKRRRSHRGPACTWNQKWAFRLINVRARTSWEYQALFQIVRKNCAGLSRVSEETVISRRSTSPRRWNCSERLSKECFANQFGSRHEFERQSWVCWCESFCVKIDWKVLNCIGTKLLAFIFAGFLVLSIVSGKMGMLVSVSWAHVIRPCVCWKQSGRYVYTDCMASCILQAAGSLYHSSHMPIVVDWNCVWWFVKYMYIRLGYYVLHHFPKILFRRDEFYFYLLHFRLQHWWASDQPKWEGNCKPTKYPGLVRVLP